MQDLAADDLYRLNDLGREMLLCHSAPGAP